VKLPNLFAMGSDSTTWGELSDDLFGHDNCSLDPTSTNHTPFLHQNSYIPRNEHPLVRIMIVCMFIIEPGIHGG
jgi:hypothetical protein